jgi:hypothetical protein
MVSASGVSVDVFSYSTDMTQTGTDVELLSYLGESENDGSEYPSPFEISQAEKAALEFSLSQIRPDSTHNWNSRFQEIYSDYYSLRGGIGELIAEFSNKAMVVAKSIISERHLADEVQTYKPLAKAGGAFGLAGGEKCVSLQ